MSRRHHRHPYVETAVFAAALLLAAFVGRELWLRRESFAPKPPAEPAKNEPLALNPERPPLPVLPGKGRTETAVSGAPAIKLTRVQRRPRKSEPVPAPR